MCQCDGLEFEYVNPNTGETKKVYMSKAEIQVLIEDELFEKLSECNCQPIGESTFVDCSCYEQYEDFELKK